MEHARNDTHQFVDTELYMILDKYTREPIRVFKGGGIYGTKEEALHYLMHCKGALGNWTDRRVIVKLSCIAGFPIGTVKAKNK